MLGVDEVLRGGKLGSYYFGLMERIGLMGLIRLLGLMQLGLIMFLRLIVHKANNAIRLIGK